MVHHYLCHTPNAPTALPVGVSRVMPPLGGITPLTCTIFDSIFCGCFQFETALVFPRFLPLLFLSKFFLLAIGSSIFRLQIHPNLRLRILLPNSPSFSLQRHKSPQTYPQGQYNNQQSHFNKCCNSRKEKDTILTVLHLLSA